jgi:hypothetical protein
MTKYEGIVDPGDVEKQPKFFLSKTLGPYEILTFKADRT